MKTRRLLLCAIVAALPLLASAQVTYNDLESDLGARVSLSLDKKIVKGLHVELSSEGRLTDNFSNFGRIDAGLGVSYKINDNFKVGAGYILIDKKNSSDEWKMRHRLYADGTATLRAGNWRVSLKERLQLTHRDVKAYKHENTPNSIALKSRVKVAYKAPNGITPYGFVEVRNVFNDPACKATWSTASLAFTDYEFTGYTDTYVNRVRGSLGAEWKIDKHNALDFSILADYCYDKEIDTGSQGTVLKSLSYDRSFNTTFRISYQFSF